jgi:hypothetical protein
MNGKERSEAKQAVVESAEALMVQTVKKLASCSCPPELLEEAAREELLALKPHLQEALEALEDIQRSRSLSDKELSQQYAFKMLLVAAGGGRGGRRNGGLQSP